MRKKFLRKIVQEDPTTRLRTVIVVRDLLVQSSPNAKGKSPSLLSPGLGFMVHTSKQRHNLLDTMAEKEFAIPVNCFQSSFSREEQKEVSSAERLPPSGPAGFNHSQSRNDKGTMCCRFNKNAFEERFVPFLNLTYIEGKCADTIIDIVTIHV